MVVVKWPPCRSNSGTGWRPRALDQDAITVSKALGRRVRSPRSGTWLQGVLQARQVELNVPGDGGCGRSIAQRQGQLKLSAQLVHS
jgi:hypothetical protein